MNDKILGEELEFLSKNASLKIFEAMRKIERGFLEESRNLFLEASEIDLSIARTLEKRGLINLSGDFYMSSGNSCLQVGENEKALSIFNSAFNMKDLSRTTKDKLEYLITYTQMRANFITLSIKEKKVIEAIMGLLIEEFGYLGGRGTVMKIFHLFSLNAGRFALPILGKGRVSYSPIYYSEINEFIKIREQLNFLVRNSKKHLIPSKRYNLFLTGEKESFIYYIEKISPELSLIFKNIIYKFGDYSMNDWEEYEEIELGVTRTRNFGGEI